MRAAFFTDLSRHQMKQCIVESIENCCFIHQGIILQLAPDRAGVEYFDMSTISNFDEEETFFCEAKMRIVDIFINGESNKKKTTALVLLQRILSGSLFCYKW
eukprot:125992_1